MPLGEFSAASGADYNPIRATCPQPSDNTNADNARRRKLQEIATRTASSLFPHNGIVQSLLHRLLLHATIVKNNGGPTRAEDVSSVRRSALDIKEYTL